MHMSPNRLAFRQPMQGRKTQYLAVRYVTHITAYGSYFIAHGPKKRLVVRGTLKEVLAEFGDDFMMIHASILVRRTLVRRLDRLTSRYTGELKLVGIEKAFPVSRYRYNAVKTDIEQWRAQRATA